MANGRHGGFTRQRKHWVSMGTNITQQVSADVTGLVSGQVNRSSPFTVLRMIGEYSIGPGAVNVINDQCAWGLGIGVVSKDAADLGGTAMPDPIDEPDYPWLFWANHVLEMPVAQQDSLGDPRMVIRREYDVKSMRKIKVREALAQIFQFKDINGAPTFDLTWGITRVLIGE